MFVVCKPLSQSVVLCYSSLNDWGIASLQLVLRFGRSLLIYRCIALHGGLDNRQRCAVFMFLMYCPLGNLLFHSLGVQTGGIVPRRVLDLSPSLIPSLQIFAVSPCAPGHVVIEILDPPRIHKRLYKEQAVMFTSRFRVQVLEHAL